MMTARPGAVRALTLSEPELRSLLNELAQLREQRDELQKRGTELLEAKRACDRRAQVRTFHMLMGIPVNDGYPAVPGEERVRLRLRLITEEFFELLSATFHYGFKTEHTTLMMVVDDFELRVDFPELVDALADLDYVIEGTRLDFGVDGAPVAALVHAANMAKAGGALREDGKEKPPGWSAPDISGELRRQGWKG